MYVLPRTSVDRVCRGLVRRSATNRVHEALAITRSKVKGVEPLRAALYSVAIVDVGQPASKALHTAHSHRSIND